MLQYKFKLDAFQIVGRVLYTFADSKVISLSLLPGMLECIQPVVPPLRGISIGDIKEGDISSISKANDVYLRVENELALASVSCIFFALCCSISSSINTNINTGSAFAATRSLLFLV